MTEKEKARQGYLYDANFEPSLLKERAYADELCYDYNMLRPSLRDEKRAVLEKLLGRIAPYCVILQPFRCDYGYNIECGENFFLNYNAVILDAAKVTFGDNVFIAPNCSFYTAGHPYDIEQRNRGLEYALPITVGNNVWIGGNVVVCPGVTIGDGCVIGAGSVVTKDIPAGMLAAGNPCRVIREINDRDRAKYRVYEGD